MVIRKSEKGCSYCMSMIASYNKVSDAEMLYRSLQTTLIGKDKEGHNMMTLDSKV